MEIVILKVRNKTLYKKIENFVTATIDLLRKFALEEALPLSHASLFEKRLETDFFHFIFRHSMEIQKLSEFVNCAKYLLRNSVTRRALGWTDEQGQPAQDLPFKLTYFRLLYSLLGHYINEVGQLSFVRNKFDIIYMEFEKHIYTSTVLYKMTAPLSGISGDIEKVDFGGNFKLRRILDSEKAAYLQLAAEPFPNPFGDLDIELVDYVLEVPNYHHKGKSLDISFCREGLEDIVTVLRLFKLGLVEFSVIKTETITWTPFATTTYAFGHRLHDTRFAASYELNKSEKKGLLRLWRRFKSFKNAASSSRSGRYANLAIKRFNLGVEESDYENKIIDFFVAFEALCLPEKDELAYRLSSRLALLLGNSDEEAERIRKFITKAYAIRSRIVHGAEIKSISINGESIELREFAQGSKNTCVSL